MMMPQPLHTGIQYDPLALHGFGENLVVARQEAGTPRTELLSPLSAAGPRDAPLLPVRSERHSHRRDREVVRAERERALAHMPPQDLLRILIDQEQDVEKMRAVIRLAYQSLELETKRAAEAERANQEALQRFRQLNESRLGAQREARKTAQELEAYKLQLEQAQNEIYRAQGVLQSVERRREDAEAAAARARQKTRQLHQLRVEEAAREEGRRHGFQSGFQQAQQEQGLASGEGVVLFPALLGPSRHVPTGEDQNPDDDDDYQNEAYDEDHRANGPHQRMATQYRDVVSPFDHHGVHGIRPFPEPRTLAQPEGFPPSEADPSVNPHPGMPHSPTPSVQPYPIEIPTTEQIERQFSINSRTKKTGGHDLPRYKRFGLRNRPPDNYIPASNDVGAFSIPAAHEFNHHQPSSSSSIAFAPNPWIALSDPERHSDSERGLRDQGDGGWYRRGSSSQDHTNGTTESEHHGIQQSKPWYQRRPSVRVRDYGFRKRAASIDSGSHSTHISEFDLVSPPDPSAMASTSTGTTKVGGDGGFWKRILREKNKLLRLSMIKEELSRQVNGLSSSQSLHGRTRSEEAHLESEPPPFPQPAHEPPSPSFPQPVHEPPSQSRPAQPMVDQLFPTQLNLDPPPPPTPPKDATPQAISSRLFADGSRYSDPRNVEQWRRSTTTPPRTPRDRPARTLAQPPQSQSALFNPSIEPRHSSTSPNNDVGPSFGFTQTAVPGTTPRSSRHAVSQSESASVGIAIEPPSQSASHSSGHYPTNQLLSPTQTPQPQIPQGKDQARPRSTSQTLSNVRSQSVSPGPSWPKDSTAPLVPQSHRNSRRSTASVPRRVVSSEIPHHISSPRTPRTPLQGASLGGPSRGTGAGGSTFPIPSERPLSINKRPESAQPGESTSRPRIQTGSVHSSLNGHVTNNVNNNNGGPATPTQSAHGHGQELDPLEHLLSPMNDLSVNLNRMPSDASLHSAGSYARFDSAAYRDPAFFSNNAVEEDDDGGLVGFGMDARGGVGVGGRMSGLDQLERQLSRRSAAQQQRNSRASSASALSYFPERRR